jgi:predicted nucleotidyltransferase
MTMNEIMSTLKPVINSQKIEQRLGISLEEVSKFCQGRKITELALFGSVLREDFNAESDIDFLVTFSPEAKIGLVEIDEIEEELKRMVKREIDLIFKDSIEVSHNWIRRRNILGTAEVIYGER